MMIYNVGQECGAVFNKRQCNSYLLIGEKNIIIDTVPDNFSEEYIKSVGKYISPKEIDYIILTSGTPERAGCIHCILECNPDIIILSTVAGLRNLKQILNNPINERMCKNKELVQLGEEEFQFFITPNLPNPDTMMIYSKGMNALFSGELYACDNDGISSDFYKKIMTVLPFAQSAHSIVKDLVPGRIYSSTGDGVVTEGAKVISLYNFLNDMHHSDGRRVLIVYSSLSGNNMKLAIEVKRAVEKCGGQGEIISLNSEDYAVAADKLGSADALVLGTYTNNRTMPIEIWGFLSNVDVNNANSKPYFVFSSFGWSSEGAYISNEILSLLKMRRACKPVECEFTPTDTDLENINIAVDGLMQMLSKKKEKP